MSTGRKKDKLFRILCFVLLLMGGALTEAHASHFRFGHITWTPRPDVSPTTVDIHVSMGYRASYFRRPQVGQTFSHTGINFGDGKSVGILTFRVFAYNAAEDWVLGRATVQHTYPSVKQSDGRPWVISFSICCRIGGLRNGASSASLRALVDLTDGNASPVSNLPAIVTCGKAQPCSFMVPAVDAAGDKLRWRLSTRGESSIYSLPAGLSIDADTGVLTWAALPSAPLGLYAVQVTIEDLTASGTVKTSVAIDFIIKLADVTANRPPAFDIPPTPAPNQTLLAYVGQPLTFTVQATDPDAGNTVSLNHVGLPDGATFIASAPSNPGTATFSWTPTAEVGSEAIVTFTAIDNVGYSALPHPVTIKVIDSKIRDVRVIDTIPTVDVEVDPASFSIAPYRIETVGGVTEVEWRFETFAVEQVTDLGFELVVKNPKPGETRVVSHKVELSYRDENGTEIRRELGVQDVEVLPSTFTVDVSTDKALYADNETVEIVSQVRNLSEFPATSSVRFSIQDAGAAVVTVLGSVPSLELAAAEARIFNEYDFFTGQTYAGSYRAVAELLDAQGNVIAQGAAPFSIDVAAAAQVGARVATDKASYVPGETVRIEERIRNLATNALLDATIAVTKVYSPTDALFWAQPGEVPQLTPQGFYDLGYSLPLGQAEPGSYRVVLEVADAAGVVRATAESTIQVESTSTTGDGLRGQITASPAPVLRTEPLAISAAIYNGGNAAVSNLPVTLSIIDPSTATIVEQWDEVVPGIGIDGTYAIHRAWPALGRVGATYAAVLTAHATAGDRVIGIKTFTIGEKLHSDLAMAGRGRLLVLLDPPAADKGACNAVSEIRLDLRPEVVLLPADRIQVDLYDEQGGLVDSETLVLGNGEAADAVPSAPANLAIAAASADRAELILAAAVGQSTLGGMYRLLATHWQGGTPRIYESGLIAADCELLQSGQTYGAYTLVDLLGEDAPDPHGPRDAASNLVQRRFLEELLASQDWSYKITTSADDFEAEFESGGYTVYGLFQEQVKLPETLQASLVAAVKGGAGLFYAGYHDQRNGRLEPALGVKVHGKRPKASGVRVLPSEFHDGADAVFSSGSKPLRAEAAEAVPLGYFSQSQDLAIARHSYGEGHSVFMGFDVLLEAAARGKQGLLAELIHSGLTHVHPTSLDARAGRVVPITLTLRNVGTPVPGQVVLALPATVSLVDPGAARLLSSGSLLWPFEIDQDQELAWTFWIRLNEPGLSVFDGVISVGTGFGDLIEYGPVSLGLPVGAAE